MQRIVSLIIIWAICAGAVVLGSQGSVSYSGFSLFAVSGIVIVLVQWLAFVPAWLMRSEHFYDLMGTTAFLLAVWIPIALMPSVSTAAYLAAAMVSLWSVRLGGFLLLRVKQRGGDERFVELKQHGLRFFLVWNMQAIWVLVTVAPALYVITRPDASMSLLSWVGIEIAFIGFLFEAVADHQKMKHVNAGNKGFMRTGLWARSQQPNYFGEIVMWFGMALMATSMMQGWAYLLWLSPVMVMLLLTRVSGVPLALKRAKEKYGDDPEWQHYRKTVPLLWPSIKR